MHTPARHLTGLAERVQKEAPVIVIMKNSLPPVSPGHDVVIAAPADWMRMLRAIPFYITSQLSCQKFVPCLFSADPFPFLDLSLIPFP